MNTHTILTEEYNDICRHLERFHEIFGTLWRISNPHYSEEVPTAAVAFNPAGDCIDFIINKKYWESIDDYTKEFVICHEMLHVILEHGQRMIKYKGQYSPDVLNIAVDLAVNHLLLNVFGFNKFHIDGWKDLVWCDTVFKDLELQPNKSFEYYIAKIKDVLQKVPTMQFQINPKGHDYLENLDKDTADKIKRAINKENKKLSDKEMEEALNDPTRELGYSEIESDYFDSSVRKNVKLKKIKPWESVLDKYVAVSEKEREMSQWARINRRMAAFPKSKMFIPSEMESIGYEVSKIQVWFFQDTSGSCVEFADRFFKAAESLPKDRFEVKMHCFDKEYQKELEMLYHLQLH